MIQINSLYKSFDGHDVLTDINTEFTAGINNLIIGQSGSGKTVLLKCIVGLFRPEKGSIFYEGKDFLTMSAREIKTLRMEMGMIFQGAALFDSLSVMENVLFPLRMFSAMTLREKIKRAHFCIERVNLSKAEHLFPSEISGGMKKRVAIARAIALNPKYLFCDEPNSGLDPKTSLLIDELIGDITKEYKITTIINTHDMNSVLGMGDHILFIDKGKNEWEGNKDLVTRSGNKRLDDFIFASDLFKKVKEAENQRNEEG